MNPEQRSVKMVEVNGKKVPEDPTQLDGLLFNARIDDPDIPDMHMKWQGTVRVPHPDILVVENAMPFLHDLPVVAEDAGAWHPSGTIDGSGGNAVSDYRSSEWTGLVPTDPTHLGRYARLIGSYEAQFIRFYCDFINPMMSVEHSSGWELLRYGPDDEFREHVDTANYRPSWSHETLGSQLGILTQRRLSVVAFCNDGFDGGLLVFRRQRLVLNPGAGAIPPELAGYRVIKLSPGGMVAWPSGAPFAHQATPVRPLPGQVPGSTKRFAAVTWLY